MIRTQIQLTEKQNRLLKRLATRKGISLAEVIRRAVDGVIESGDIPDRQEVKRRALAAVGVGRSNVKDLSTRHDEYLAEIYSK